MKVIKKDGKSAVSLSQLLANHVLLSSLTDTERTEVFENMFSVTARPGQLIIKQGDEGDNFFIIEQVGLVSTPVILFFLAGGGRPLSGRQTGNIYRRRRHFW